jgi:2-keto-4-pentenoate hydratase/2-oxohepta-3-ene-1,7-dioic acid hydratase in catechol pathway
MVARINGESVCESSTGTAYWTWGQVIEHVSRNETLLPGDVLGSGTVAGGSRLESGGPFLQPGDDVELEIEKLGVLRTTIGRRS